jgi:hypothetical protein
LIRGLDVQYAYKSNTHANIVRIQLFHLLLIVVTIDMRLFLVALTLACIIRMTSCALVVAQQFLTKNEYNLQWKYGTAQTVKWITIHNTANKASAQNEATYLNNRRDNQYISFHYVVDDKQALHLLPDNM